MPTVVVELHFSRREQRHAVEVVRNLREASEARGSMISDVGVEEDRDGRTMVRIYLRSGEVNLSAIDQLVREVRPRPEPAFFETSWVANPARPEPAFNAVFALDPAERAQGDRRNIRLSIDPDNPTIQELIRNDILRTRMDPGTREMDPQAFDDDLVTAVAYAVAALKKNPQPAAAPPPRKTRFDFMDDLDLAV